MPNMKALSLMVKKLYTMIKFAGGQTHGRTDRVITIGHPPSGRALMSKTRQKFRFAIEPKITHMLLKYCYMNAFDLSL